VIKGFIYFIISIAHDARLLKQLHQHRFCVSMCSGFAYIKSTNVPQRNMQKL